MLPAALQLQPDYATAHYNLGTLFKDQGKLDEAVPCYQRALQLKPDHPLAHYNLGVVCQGQGKLDEAMACYQRACNCNLTFLRRTTIWVMSATAWECSAKPWLVIGARCKSDLTTPRRTTIWAMLSGIWGKWMPPLRAISVHGS